MRRWALCFKRLQADGNGCRCDPGCDAAWRSRACSFCGLRNAAHGSRADRAAQRGAVTNRKAHSMTDNEATNFHKLPEVPMNPHGELLLWHALHRLEVTYWYDGEFNEGRTAHELFTPDGVKMVGHNRFEGRKEIRAFYEWRARQNVATAVRQLGIIGV